MAARIAFLPDGADPASADPVAREPTPPNLLIALHAPLDMGRFDVEWVADNDEVNARFLEHLGRCALADHNHLPRPDRQTDRPPAREHIQDPHSAWYGEQAARKLESVGAHAR